MNNPKNENPPGLICIKDIIKITAKSPRTARRISLTIRRKTNCRYVSIDAFCEYTGLTFEMLTLLLQK